MKKDLDREFEVFYPNVYEGEDSEIIAKVKASIDDPSAVGPFGPMGPRVADERDMLTYAKTWTPYNQFYTDKEYAEKSVFGEITAFPCYIEPMAGTPRLPPTLGVFGPGVNGGGIPGDGKDNEIFFHKPILLGDVLTTKSGKQWLEDITDPDGSNVRVFRMGGEGEMYNQRGELVASCVMRELTCFKRRADPAKRIPGESIFPAISYLRESHTYTDDDYEYIKSLWNAEKVRAAEPLYWEDVNVGDEPVPTCDGPITDMDMIRLHGAQITGSDPLRDRLLGPGGNFGLGKDRFGLYYMDFATHYTAKNDPKARSIFYNTTGRNFVIRMLTNWMGDAGFLSKIAWRLVIERPAETQYNVFPDTYDRPSYLFKVPYLKAQGKYMNSHGMCGDLAISKGYVYDKYEKDGEFFVSIACWCEDIDGRIFQECDAAVKLPSKIK